MANKHGWWELVITEDIELNDNDLAHIAEQIQDGFSSGEIVEDQD